MLNICMCGTQDGYPHSPTCPFPLFRGSKEREREWEHRHDLIRKLFSFEQELKRSGVGDAPNGATYKLCPFGPTDRPACERRIPDGKGGASREIITGFSSRIFETWDDVRVWAIADGRSELPANRPLSERRQLA